MVNDYTEEWGAANANWTYDGDEDFATYPGMLATLATSTAPVFTPQASYFDPWPRVLTAPYPLRVIQTLRCISDGSLNSNFGIFTFSVLADFSVDYIQVAFTHILVGNEYIMEVFGTQNGISYYLIYNTGIPRAADQDFVIEIVISPTGYEVLLDSISIMTSSGFVFPEIAYMDFSIQRHAAGRQGMLKSSRIYTAEPVLGASFDLIAPASGVSIRLGSADFSWTAFTEAESYTVQISDTPDFANIISSKTTTARHAEVPFPLGGIYYWRVAAQADSDITYSDSYRTISSPGQKPLPMTTHEADGAFRLLYQFREDQ